jgi:hypothetical protein
MPRARPRSWLVGAAIGLASAPAFAEDLVGGRSDSPAADEPGVPVVRPWPRREITLSLGYGSMSSAGSFVRSDPGPKAPSYEAGFSGWTLEVTGRRFPHFEYGFLAWSKGDSSDGKGSFAHALLRLAVEARWLPWGYGWVEPWVGAQLGVVAADDYAKWDATEAEREHSVSVARFGDAAALEAGLRGRLGEFFALGLRGGLLYMNLPQVRAVVTEPGDAKGDYFVRPTDYSRRLWFSLLVSAEITVPD